MSALEDELDKRANEAEGSVVHTAFGHPNVQSHMLSPISPPQPLAMNTILMVSAEMHHWKEWELCAQPQLDSP